MEGDLITVILIGSPEKEKNLLFHGLTQSAKLPVIHRLFPVARGPYRYCNEEYLLLNLPEKGQEKLMTQLLDTGRADILLVLCSAHCLEQGLKHLSRLLKLPSIKEEALPVVFCISFSRAEIKENIFIDFDLLEDVLQVPVLPYYSSSPICLDDIKTAVSSVWNHIFSYECLDFSPRKLAAETTTYFAPTDLSWKKNLDMICLMIFFILFLIWLLISGAQLPSLCLWRIIYWVQKKAAGLLMIIF